MNGMRLNNITDLHRGRALSAEIDNRRLVERMNYKLPIIKAETAANRLIRISSKNHFTLFEIFHTDHLGHGRNIEWLEYTTGVLDRFLYHIITNLKKEMTLVVCSDHGNFEDLSIKMHTLNPAIGITAGKNAELLSKKIKKLYDIKPAIMEMYD
jgi:phosphopentomutase